MHDQPAAARLDVAGRHHIGREHHQVGFERELRDPAARRDHVGPEREVRHELTVHHVPLDAVHPGLVECDQRFAELGEVDGQDGRGDLDRQGHAATITSRRRGRAGG
jgi:hypothetical protein